jgi:hypothetical protein
MTRLTLMSDSEERILRWRYLLRYAQEASWREDHRRMSNGDQVHMVAALSMKGKPSVDFSGYWQRHVQGG